MQSGPFSSGLPPFHFLSGLSGTARGIRLRLIDVRWSKKAPRILRGASGRNPVARLWRGVWRVRPKMPLIAQEPARAFCQQGQGEIVELTGFEPVTPSLRKIRSKTSDQEKRYVIAVLWSGCGAIPVRQGEISAAFTKSVASHDRIEQKAGGCPASPAQINISGRITLISERAR